MRWYDYVMCFFGGAFLANYVPHFARGICGEPFPTPFASPPGRGLSSPAVNVLWAMLNLVVAYVLLRYGRFSLQSWATVVVALAGALAIGLQLSRAFAGINGAVTQPRSSG